MAAADHGTTGQQKRRAAPRASILALLLTTLLALPPSPGPALAASGQFAWAGSSGGSPQTTLPLGVNLHPLQNIYAIYPPDQLADRVVALGASVVRIDVHWDWLEWTGPGVDQ